MNEYILKMFGQTAEQQAKGDMGDYDSETGKLDRGPIESWFDSMLGRTESVQTEAQDQYVKGLESTQAGDSLLTLRPDAKITPTTQKRDLRRDLLTAQNQDALISDIKATGLSTRSKSELQGMSVEDLTSLRTDLIGKKKDADSQKPGGAQWSATRQEERDKESDKRYQSELEYRKWSTEKDDAWRKYQSEKEDKRLDMQMELAQLDRADRREDRRIAREDKAADRRQQSIMMLIKGLAQLGQGFSL